jgi:hypothetical protein
MTSDRDRLAADLCEAGDMHGPMPDRLCPCGREDHAIMADRLIARGWTRDRSERRLDEERLADAIFLAGLTAFVDETREFIDSDKAAAAIAKAYREDTDPEPDYVAADFAFDAAREDRMFGR